MRKLVVTVFALLILTVPLTVLFASGQQSAAGGDDLYEITVAKWEHAAQPIIPDAPAHQAILDKFNIKINFLVTARADYYEKLALWLATNQMPDLAWSTLDYIRTSLDSSVQSLTPLINEYAPNLQRYIEDNPAVKKVAVDGNMYYLPTQYYNRKVVSSYPMIRYDRLEELGLSKPKTWDELYDVLLAFKAAYPDSLIWSNRWGTGRLLSLVAYPMGSGWDIYYDRAVDGGRWQYGPVHEEFEYVLNYLASAYEDGLLDPDYAVSTPDQWHEKNSSDRTMWTYENMTFGTRWNAALVDLDPSYKWGPIPTLEGLRGRRMATYKGLLGGYAMGSNAEDPVRIIKMLDWFMSPEGLDTTNWGIEGENFRYKDGKSQPSRVNNYTMASLAEQFSPANKEVLPSLWAKYDATTDPLRNYQSDMGVGLLDFTILVDSAMEYVWDPPGETDSWYEMTANDPGLHDFDTSPPFTIEEADRIKDIKAELGPIFAPAFDSVIIGNMTIAEYRVQVQRAIDAGALELEEIYNAAEDRIK